MKMSEFKRTEQKERAFKQRYGKDVEVYLWRESSDLYHIKIKTPQKEYILSEKLDKGTPVYTNLEFDGKLRRYPVYIFAEIDVADDIGGNQ
jgi:hypothetical protein